MTDPADKPVADLLRGFVQRGSQDDFRALVTRFTPLVYHTAVRRTGSASLAADVVQEVFIDLAKRAPALRADERLGAWLHQRALYASADMLRGEMRRRTREQTAAAMHTPNPATPATA